MAFQVIEKKAFTSCESIPDGFCSVDRGGTGRFHTEDLALVEIDKVAIVLVDEMTLRIGLRKPRPGEEAKAYLCRPVYAGRRPDEKRRQVSLRSALSELRIDPEAAAGRYELTTKDDLLIINLAGIEAKEAAENAKQVNGDDE